MEVWLVEHKPVTKLNMELFGETMRLVAETLNELEKEGAVGNIDCRIALGGRNKDPIRTLGDGHNRNVVVIFDEEFMDGAELGAATV